MDSDAIAANLREAIKSARERLGFSLQDLADRAGLSKAHVWMLEQGKAKNPTVSSLVAIGRATGTSVSALLGEDPSKPNLHPVALRLALDVDRELTLSNNRTEDDE